MGEMGILNLLECSGTFTNFVSILLNFRIDMYNEINYMTTSDSCRKLPIIYKHELLHVMYILYRIKKSTSNTIYA